MTITVVFDPPLPSDSPATFNTKAFTTLGDLNDWSTEANALAADVTAKQSTASTAATTATTQAGISTTKAGEASASALAADASADAAAASAASVVAIEVTTHAATSKATPVDADEFPMSDSAASWGLKKLTWANLKATLATWIGGGTIAASFTTLAASGNATIGDAEATDVHTVKGATTVLANSASPALKITQTGAGNAFVVEDSASTDSTPFVIDASGRTIMGYTTVITGSQLETHGVTDAFKFSADSAGQFLRFFKGRGTAAAPWTTAVASGDSIASLDYYGADGAGPILAARITASVDGTPGTNSMPGRLVFSTTSDGAGSPTERMRIDSSGNVLVTNAGGLGYGAGAGGTVTQATSRTTGVTLNKPTGAITMFTAAGSTTPGFFTVTNSVVGVNDTVVVSIRSGATNYYIMEVVSVYAGGFNVGFWTSGGTASDTPIINFTVIKGATS